MEVPKIEEGYKVNNSHLFHLFQIVIKITFLHPLQPCGKIKSENVQMKKDTNIHLLNCLPFKGKLKFIFVFSRSHDP